LVSCSTAEEATPAVTAVDTTAIPTIKDSLSTLKPTETFRGTYQEKEVVFSHVDFKSYSLNMGGVLSSGALKTERGYGDDPNATVYVLNSDKPKNERNYFVRTPTGSVYMLDDGRYVMDDATFEPVTGAAIKPPIAEKPNVEKTVKEKAVAKKPVVSEKPNVEKTVKEKAVVKKPKVKKSTKKKRISKTKKKKKPVKKAKKKNRKKKKSVSKSAVKEPTKSTQK
jgi:hypothetical protein